MTIEALQRLCSMKNQVQLTPHAAETWAAALAQFDPGDVRFAILKIGLSTDPFPDVAKIIQAAEDRRRERKGLGPVNANTPRNVGKLAEAFGIDIDPKSS